MREELQYTHNPRAKEWEAQWGLVLPQRHEAGLRPIQQQLLQGRTPAAMASFVDRSLRP